MVIGVDSHDSCATGTRLSNSASSTCSTWPGWFSSKTKLRTRLLPASSAKGESAKAMRYLCRRLSAAVCWQVADDACGRHEMSPEGTSGRRYL